jgi:hypothetical protein
MPKLREKFNGVKTKERPKGKYWYKDGQLHRDDGPAVEQDNGTKRWYKHGKKHRDDGPAVIWPDGSKLWYQDGKPHRDDGPAWEIKKNREERWYKHGVMHRDGGPAFTKDYGFHEEWYQNGKLHREDGPAFKAGSGWERWYLNGKEWPEGPDIWAARLAEKAALAQQQRDDEYHRAINDNVVLPRDVRIAAPLRLKKQSL